MNSIVLSGTRITLSNDGLYCLNDLHRAAVANGMATESQRPSNFISSQSEFISQGCLVKVVKGGISGSYGDYKVLMAYAEWIYGAKFKIKLFQAVNDYNALIEALEHFDVPDDIPDMFIYGIRESETGRIKIGISKDPENRLRQLQIGNSQKLEIVYVRKALNRFKDERQLHKLNSDKKIRSEWFESDACLA